MDVFAIVCVILGTVCITEVTGLLHCLQCTHIIWEQDNKNFYINEEQMQGGNLQPGRFSWVKGIDDMITARFSPACAQSDPLNWNGGQASTNFQLGNDVCPADSSAERCTFLYGTLSVYISQYDKTINLQMYIRGCQQVEPLLENRCYERNFNGPNSGIAGNRIKIDFQNELSFLGPGTTVRTFNGRQCICDNNRCVTFTQGSKAVSGSIITIIMAAMAYLVLKV